MKDMAERNGNLLISEINIENTPFGKKVKAILFERGQSLEDLASQIQVRPRALRKILRRGDVLPNWIKDAVAAALEVPNHAPAPLRIKYRVDTNKEVTLKARQLFSSEIFEVKPQPHSITLAYGRVVRDTSIPYSVTITEYTYQGSTMDDPAL